MPKKPLEYYKRGILKKTYHVCRESKQSAKDEKEKEKEVK